MTASAVSRFTVQTAPHCWWVAVVSADAEGDWELDESYFSEDEDGDRQCAWTPGAVFLDMLLSYTARGRLLKRMPAHPEPMALELPGFDKAIARLVEKAREGHFMAYEDAREDAEQRGAEWRRSR